MTKFNKIVCRKLQNSRFFIIFLSAVDFCRSGENFVPSVLARYRQQILFPVLRCLLAVLMSLGADNEYAVNQVDVTFTTELCLIKCILQSRNVTFSRYIT